MTTQTEATCPFCKWTGPETDAELLCGHRRCPECAGAVETACDAPDVIVEANEPSLADTA